MKVLAIIAAVLLMLTGGVWMGQGLGFIKGSIMTGDMAWFWTGLVLVVAGLLILGLTVILGRRREKG